LGVVSSPIYTTGGGGIRNFGADPGGLLIPPYRRCTCSHAQTKIIELCLSEL